MLTLTMCVYICVCVCVFGRSGAGFVAEGANGLQRSGDLNLRKSPGKTLCCDSWQFVRRVARPKAN